MHHKWSEIQLEKGIIREGGAAYKRMLKFKDELEEIIKKKRINRLRRATRLILLSNGKASK